MASTIKALTATGSAIYFTPRHLAVLLFCLRAEQLITDDDGDRGEIARIIRDRFEDTPAAIQAPCTGELEQLAGEIQRALPRGNRAES